MLSSGDLPDSRIKPMSLMSPALAVRFFFFFFFTTSVTWEALNGKDMNTNDNVATWRGICFWFETKLYGLN